MNHAAAIPPLRLVLESCDPFERATEKIRALGQEAMLTLPEAASVLDVSPSTFERLAIPCIQWAGRSRRWRYGAIVERGRQVEGG